MTLIANDISAVNAHTNLDCADGGVNDTLAALLGLTDISVIGSEHLLRAGLFESSLPACGASRTWQKRS
jgi:putative NIF3 family GTP cyclohydrolase 1 type 2